MAHRVSILVFDGVVPADFATPCELFSQVRLENGRLGYEVELCGVKREVRTHFCTLIAPYTLSALTQADTVIVPGLHDLDQPISLELLEAIRAAAKRGTRIASICSGAFVLAATGLLDGLRATTHWLAAAELGRRYPAIEVDPNVLYVDEGNLLTSAGAAAGLDLCLHMVRCDYGPAVAARSARLSVVPLERAGGQAQFIQQAPPVNDRGSLNSLLQWIEQNFDKALNLEALSKQAAMSVRTLNRRFREQTGHTPMDWVLQIRIRSAQHLLETTSLSVERVSSEVGFGSSGTFREHFLRIVGVSPLVYRRAFRAKGE